MEQKFPMGIFELIITRVREMEFRLLGFAVMSDKCIMSDPLITYHCFIIELISSAEAFLIN